MFSFVVLASHLNRVLELKRKSWIQRTSASCRHRFAGTLVPSEAPLNYEDAKAEALHLHLPTSTQSQIQTVRGGAQQVEGRARKSSGTSVSTAICQVLGEYDFGGTHGSCAFLCHSSVEVRRWFAEARHI